jgi:hypothetical protein
MLKKSIYIILSIPLAIIIGAIVGLITVGIFDPYSEFISEADGSTGPAFDLFSIVFTTVAISVWVLGTFLIVKRKGNNRKQIATKP